MRRRIVRVALERGPFYLLYSTVQGAFAAQLERERTANGATGSRPTLFNMKFFRDVSIRVSSSCFVCGLSCITAR